MGTNIPRPTRRPPTPAVNNPVPEIQRTNCPYCGKHREKQYVAIDVMTGKPFDLKEFIERDVNK